MTDQDVAGWRHIRSAPKDRMFIWARPKGNGKWGVGLAYPTISNTWADAYGDRSAPAEATRWHEMPAPPTDFDT